MDKSGLLRNSYVTPQRRVSEVSLIKIKKMAKTLLIGVVCERLDGQQRQNIITTWTAIAKALGRHRSRLDIPDQHLKMYVHDYRQRRQELNQALATNWGADDYCLWCLKKYNVLFNRRPRPAKEKAGQTLRQLAPIFTLEKFYEDSRNSQQN